MVRLASYKKFCNKDDLAIFIYMGDAFIVSLMLQWLNNRVLNVKHFNRSMKQTQDTTYMYYIVLFVYLTWGYKTIKQGSFQILELT